MTIRTSQHAFTPDFCQNAILDQIYILRCDVHFVSCDVTVVSLRKGQKVVFFCLLYILILKNLKI